jgi:hypothetical protein
MYSHLFLSSPRFTHTVALFCSFTRYKHGVLKGGVLLNCYIIPCDKTPFQRKAIEEEKKKGFLPAKHTLLYHKGFTFLYLGVFWAQFERPLFLIQ